ncbi:MAG: sugar phosphate isomerase/epimerase [Clostridia bacterium]|nr:sugar phosphate isomerase/epimerase [Clostridia bacterium]
MSRFKFSAGPWNVDEGADIFGPEVRETISLEDKIKKFKEIGLDAVQFHDDDAVPEINNLTEKGIKNRAKEVKEMLDQYGLAAEFVAPRLWMDLRTIDGGFTSNSPEDREFAKWRALRSVDIAKELGCDIINIWPAREGTVCYESKDPVEGVNRMIEGINVILEYDKDIKVSLETKPNEPIDRSFCPTIGHALGLAARTTAPDRVGVTMETAHAVLAGLDPASEMAFAMAFGKLWSVHLNDQNGIKYDQDKVFGAENLRQAFNQIKVLVDHGYGKGGEYIGLDVKAMRTQKQEVCYKHLENSLKIAKMLEEKANKFDKEFQNKCIQERDYEALEMYVIELLLKG